MPKVSKKPAPTKAVAAKPTKKVAAAKPSKKVVVSPTKKAAKPVNKVTSPSKKAAKPVKKVTTPNKKTAKPATKVTTPNKKTDKPTKSITKSTNKISPKPAKPVAKGRVEKAKTKVLSAKGDKTKKPRKSKDPNAPKRPLSAFILFSSDERAKVKAAHPNYTIGEIGKELGARWAKCSNKGKYEEKAKKDKARYEAAMKVYKEN